MLATAVLVALGAHAPIARAAPEDGGVDRCLGANTTAQSLRRDGKFGAARADLAVCIDARCPTLVRDDCSQRLDELNRAQPTMVFAARDEQGYDVSAVNVEIDGRPLTRRLDGIAIAIDPGEHTFTFEAPDHPPKVTQKFVLREGEKARREQIVLGGAAPRVASGVSPSSRVEMTPLRAQRVASLVALGVGLVGVGTGAAFAFRAKAKANDADAYCPDSACTNDAALRMNHDARVAGNVATVAFAAGAASIAGAVVLWLTAKPSPSSSSVEVALFGSTLRLRGTW